MDLFPRIRISRLGGSGCQKHDQNLLDIEHKDDKVAINKQSELDSGAAGPEPEQRRSCMATESLNLISIAATQILRTRATVVKSGRMLKRCKRLINLSVAKCRKTVQAIKA